MRFDSGESDSAFFRNIVTNFAGLIIEVFDLEIGAEPVVEFVAYGQI
jgi:hypothetical protein